MYNYIVNNTRQRLLEYLSSKQVATPIELSRALQVTPADIRHHLNYLLDEGHVQIIGKRKVPGPGRPAMVYRLSHKHSNSLLVLLDALLLDISNEKLSDDSENSVRRVADRISGTHQSKGNLTQRLYYAVNRLNELNYHARWEAHPDSPRIILGNCPYSLLIDSHPNLCLIDKYILEGLLNTTVSHEQKFAQDERGFSFCLFSIMSLVTQ